MKRKRKEISREGGAETSWDDLLSGPADETAEEGAAAIVVSVASGRCRLFRDGRDLDCTIPPALAVVQKSALAVGDRVLIEDDGAPCRIARVLPRRSVLARPDPLRKHVQRLIAANIDIVVHVVSAKAPPLRPRLIDRYLIAILRGRAQPAICLNKVDLLDDAERAAAMQVLAPYRELGVPVVSCSSKGGEGVDALRELLQGKTSTLVGHSGVGKSSLLNALDQRLQIAVGDLHAKRGTGKHTPPASTLHDLGGGTLIIDTPGIREFGLWDLDRDSLRDYFPELDEPSEL